MLLREQIVNFLNVDQTSFVASAIEASLMIIIILGSYLVFKNTLVKLLKDTINKSDYPFLISLSRSRVLRNITILIPFALLYALKNTILNTTVVNIYEKTFFTTLVIVSMLLIFSILNVLTESYESDERVNERFPVKPVFQIFKVITFIIAIIVIAAHFVDRSPVYVLSGLGAISAIIMFIFKDSIQSLVAAFQITLHKSVKPGDWIEVPKYAVDGEVKEINLNLISVKNWDNTTTVIPTYCLLTESFKNWTTMYKNGRRIKRPINIDVTSVKQLSDADIKRLKQVKLIKQYLEEKEVYLNQTNSALENDELLAVNGRRLTNIGTFRKYVEYYLKQNPEIIQSQLLVVRQLENQSQGIPIEVYCFTHKTSLADFEGVQSDIFDHLYSVVPLFGLNVYQKPSGQDFSSISKEIKNLEHKKIL